MGTEWAQWGPTNLNHKKLPSSYQSLSFSDHVSESDSVSPQHLHSCLSQKVNNSQLKLRDDCLYWNEELSIRGSSMRRNGWSSVVTRYNLPLLMWDWWLAWRYIVLRLLKLRNCAIRVAGKGTSQYLKHEKHYHDYRATRINLATQVWNVGHIMIEHLTHAMGRTQENLNPYHAYIFYLIQQYICSGAQKKLKCLKCFKINAKKHLMCLFCFHVFETLIFCVYVFVFCHKPKTQVCTFIKTLKSVYYLSQNMCFY